MGSSVSAALKLVGEIQESTRFQMLEMTSTFSIEQTRKKSLKKGNSKYLKANSGKYEKRTVVYATQAVIGVVIF